MLGKLFKSLFSCKSSKKTIKNDLDNLEQSQTDIIQQAQETIRHLKGEQDVLRAELECSKGEIKQKKEEIRLLIKEQERFQAELKLSKKDLEDSQNAVRRLTQEQANASTALAQLKQLLRESEDAVHKLSLERGEIISDLKRPKNQLKQRQKHEVIERKIRQGASGDSIETFSLSFCPPGQLIDAEDRIQRSFARGYWIMTTPVTRRLWRQVMGSDSSSHSEQDAPANNISWFDALLFANKLSSLDRRAPCYQLKRLESGLYEVKSDYSADGYRLPSVHEWRYAAKADEEHLFAGSDQLDSVGWYSANSAGVLHSVAKKLPNAWLIYDMSGNISEWVADPEVDQPIEGKFFDEMPNFVYSSNYTNRYTLGGNFMSNERICAVNTISQHQSNELKDYIGFRLIISSARTTQDN